MKASRWITALIALLALAAPAFADIYRWKGADGVVHFSNQPPPAGVTVLETIEETPYDAESDRLRREEERRLRQEFEKRDLEERQSALAAREREAQLKLQEAERLLEQSRQETDREDGDCDDDYFFRFGSCWPGLIINRHSGRSGPRDLYRGVYRDNNNLYYKRPEHRPGAGKPSPPGTKPAPGERPPPKPRDGKSAARSEKAPFAAGETETPPPPAPAPEPPRRK